MITLFTVTAQQISILRGISYTTARKEWHQIRDALNLSHGQPLKLRDLAAYWGQDCKELAEFLYNFRP